LETHLKEDLSEFVADLVQGMQSACVLIRTEGVEVVWLEVDRLPRSGREHIRRQIRFLLDYLEGVFWSLRDREADDSLDLDKLALPEVGDDLCIVRLVLPNV